MYTATVPDDLSVLPSDQSWPSQGQWTYEDYLRLPDNGLRYEIIKGVLYMANAPSFAHQYAVNEIAFALTAHCKMKQSGRVVSAPFEVHLAENVRPVLPDVLYLADAKRLAVAAKYFEGVPDLIVEVLSPSSRRHDMHTKLGIYEQAGVPEYWLVDPVNHFVDVYFLPEGGREYVLLQTFTAVDNITSNILPDFQLPAATVFLK